MNRFKSFFAKAPASIQVLLLFSLALPLWSLSLTIPFNDPFGLIIYSITYFFHSLTAITSSGYPGYSLIWINIGVMIYFCLNLFLFLMANHVLTRLDSETSALIWSSHNINNVIKNILFAIGIFYAKQDPVRQKL